MADLGSVGPATFDDRQINCLFFNEIEEMHFPQAFTGSGPEKLYWQEHEEVDLCESLRMCSPLLRHRTMG
jgi:hypothetical protein